MSTVQLKAEVLVTKGFVQALTRLSECRTLSAKDFASVLRLSRAAQLTFKTITDLQKANGENVDAEVTAKLNEELTLEGCNISLNATVQSKLSPQDVLSLEEFLEQKVE